MAPPAALCASAGPARRSQTMRCCQPPLQLLPDVSRPTPSKGCEQRVVSEGPQGRAAPGRGAASGRGARLPSPLSSARSTTTMYLTAGGGQGRAAGKDAQHSVITVPSAGSREYRAAAGRRAFLVGPTQYAVRPCLVLFPLGGGG